MKLAITTWGNRVSPVFDAAGTLLVAHIENQMITRKNYISFNPENTSNLIRLLKRIQVSLLICGAISAEPAKLIVDSDIKLISFVTGNAITFLENFTRQQTVKQAFIMPGCRNPCSRLKNPEKTRFTDIQGF